MNYTKRIETLQQFLNKKNVDAFLISTQENMFYFTGFFGFEAGYILITQKNVYFLTNFIYKKQAEEIFKNIKNYEIIDTKNETIKYIKKILPKNSKLFFEPLISFKDYKSLTQKLTEIEFIPEFNFIENMRIFKNDEEITAIEKALHLSEKGVYELFSNILKPGKKEKEVQAELEYFLTKNGMQETAFETIVASGKNAAYPHANTGEKLIEKNELVKIDFGAKLNCYCSDITRTFGIGNIDKKRMEIYNIVKDAQDNVFSNLKPGLLAKEIDEFARKVIKDAGYGEYFGHGLGHGVGINIHERPFIVPNSDEVIKPGMVFTVEPGIYIPGLGGVRIEDMVVITKNGYKRLNKTSRKLMLIE